MKKTVLLLFIVASALQSNAQYVTTNLALGFNQSFGGAESLNFITDRYNDTRAYLDKKMGKLNTPSGLTAELGISYKRLYIGLDHTRRRDGVVANGVDISNILQCREVERTFHTYGGDIGYRLSVSQVLSIIPGISFDFGKQEIGTRVYPDGEDKPDYTNIVLQKNLQNAGVFFKLVISTGKKAPGRFIIEPYLTYGLKEFSLTILNEALNPVSWTQDPDQLTNNNISGIKFMWAYIIGSR